MTAAQIRRITKRLLEAIEKSGLTNYEIAKRSDVSESTIWRFRNGKGSLTLDAIEKLAPVLGIDLVVKKK